MDVYVITGLTNRSVLLDQLCSGIVVGISDYYRNMVGKSTHIYKEQVAAFLSTDVDVQI